MFYWKGTERKHHSHSYTTNTTTSMKVSYNKETETIEGSEQKRIYKTKLFLGSKGHVTRYTTLFILACSLSFSTSLSLSLSLSRWPAHLHSYSYFPLRWEWRAAQMEQIQKMTNIHFLCGMHFSPFEHINQVQFKFVVVWSEHTRQKLYSIHFIHVCYIMFSIGEIMAKCCFKMSNAHISSGASK